MAELYHTTETFITTDWTAVLRGTSNVNQPDCLSRHHGRRLDAIESKSPGWRDKINLVWMLDQGEQVAQFAFKLDHLVERDFKIYDSPLEPGQGPVLLDGFERLVHQLRGVRIGLALRGGGARGIQS